MFQTDWIEATLQIGNIGKLHRVGNPHLTDIRSFSIDSRTITPEDCYVAIPGEKYDGHDFVQECHQKGVRSFIIQQDHYQALYAKLDNSFVFTVRENIISVLGHLAREYRKSIQVIPFAITGSSGKTTSREMLYRILSQKYNVHTARKNWNNEIGLPLTILDTASNTHIMILEMGMNHTGEIRRLSKIALPEAALITNIGFAHIGNLGSREAIANAKSEVFEGLYNNGAAFINRNDPYFAYLKQKTSCSILDYGPEDIKIVRNLGLEGYELEYADQIFPFAMIGKHNLANLAGAFRAGIYFGIEPTQMIQSILDFKPVSGRNEILQGRYTIINDCYNANPDSMIAALETLAGFTGRKIAVIADMLELGSFSSTLHQSIGEYIAHANPADIVLAFGENSKSYISPSRKNDRWFERKEDLITHLKAVVRPGDILLFKGSRGMKLEEAVKAVSE